MMNGNMQDAYADIRLFDYAYSLSHALSPNRRDINSIKKYNVWLKNTRLKSKFAQFQINFHKILYTLCRLNLIVFY